MSEFKKSEGASDAALKQLVKELGFSPPVDYLEFMRSTDGGEGFVGNNWYLMLWPVEKIISLNKGYEVEECAPGLILFGSDGGGEAYAFDSRSTDMRIVEVPFIGMSLDEAWYCGKTFLEFLEYLAKKET